LALLLLYEALVKLFWVYAVLFVAIALTALPGRAGYGLKCQHAQMFATKKAIKNWESRISSQYGITDLVVVKPDLDRFAHQYKALNSSQKENFAREISKAYGLAHNGKNKTELYFLKRSLDILVAQIINPHEIFLRAQQEGRSPIAAWNEVLQKTSDLIRMKDGFSAEQILKPLINLQRGLSNLGDEHHWVRETPFTIFGSYPNGRALRKVSDLDIFSEDATQRTFFGRLNSNDSAQKFDLSEFSPMAKGHDMFVFQAASKMPIMIQVDSKEIVLQIYPLLTQTQISQGLGSKPMRILLYTRP